MGLRDRLRRHRKDERTILVALLVLFLILAGVFYLILRSRDLPAYLVTDQLLLFVLFYVNGVLALAILFVLLRNVYKLVVERHNRILGANFKTKMVASFVGLSLIPVVLLFLVATELFQGSVERWFSPQVREVREQGNAVAEALSDEIEATAVRDAAGVRRRIADLDLSDPEAKPELARRLGEMLAERDLDLLAVYDGRDFVQAILDPRAGSDLPEAPAELLAAAERDGRAVRTLQAPAGLPGPLVLAAVAAPPARAAAGGEAGDGDGEAGEWTPPAGLLAADAGSSAAVVVAGRLLDPVLAEQVRELREAFLAFRQLEVQRDNLAASHLLTFLMVTLLILLASSWTGLYLARRVTVPIQALAEGTRRISLGDLDHRVDAEGDDELAVLVDSFNRMTGELRRNKEVIERSNEELLEANRRLDEERSLVAAVLDNVAAGVVSIDAEGRILTCNDAALAMLQQSAGEVVGRPVAEAWADAERARLAALVDPAAAADRSPAEVQLLLGGEPRVLEVKVTPLVGAEEASGDGGGGRVVVLEDLTDLIQAQQHAAWSEAARRIAHEIKNPLTPIRLSAERLLRKYRQGDPALGEALEEGVETIEREVRTLQAMVDEFSRYARMPRPRPEPTDVGRLVDETLDLYRDLKEGVEVGCEVAGDLGEAPLDAQQIRRALINLIDNAMEATSSPGKVTVSAARVDGHLEIQVADTGRGIPAEARDKLFLPYFSTKGRGTGLGLAIVHRIVADHRGRIRVEENRPQGTVFTLELPAG